MDAHSAPAAPSSFLAPRYWPTWLALASMWLLAQLPYRLQMSAGRTLGRAMERLGWRRRRIAAINIGLCFPDQTAAERQALLKAHFRSLGMGYVETAMAWWTPARKLEALVQVEGLEHLDAALARGKGVILLSGHFTTLEIGGRLLSLFTRFHVLYRQHKNPLFEEAMRKAREAHFENAIPRRDMRAMLRSLRSNVPVWYAPDQDYGRKQSVFVPFFGVPAATITGTARIAKSSGAAIVPFFQERLPNDAGYKLTLFPALEAFPSGDELDDARRINALIEAQVRKIPDQYLWVHRRFKNRPEGVPPVY